MNFNNILDDDHPNNSPRLELDLGEEALSQDSSTGRDVDEVRRGWNQRSSQENGQFSSQSTDGGNLTDRSRGDRCLNRERQSAGGAANNQGQDVDGESDEEQEAERSPYFSSAAEVLERDKYPVNKKSKRAHGSSQEDNESGGTSRRAAAIDDDESDDSPIGGKKYRAAVYRNATSSSYRLHAMYGQLRGSKLVSNAVRSGFKPVVDGNRSPPQMRDMLQEDDYDSGSSQERPAAAAASNGRSPVPPMGGSKKKPSERRPADSNYKSPMAAAGRFDRKRADSESEKLAQIVEREILDTSAIDVKWEDISGLGRVKKIIQEIVIWPMIRPDIFTGIRSLPRGLLLFGPPGTGKTTLGRCIASQAKATFYCISASSLTSKWVGENEKLVRALFDSARAHQPAVVFIDEIDALLSNRVEGEHDSTRRLKTQFFTELDGAKTFSEERILVVGATNRPDDLDDAARRRLTKRLYVPLPDESGRLEMMASLLKSESHSLTNEDVQTIAERTDGFSCDDLKKMSQEAALGPIRRITDITAVSTDQLPPITIEDFETALRSVRPSVSKEQLGQYEEFDRRYGSGGTNA